jgi:hypothetical protein
LRGSEAIEAIALSPFRHCEGVKRPKQSPLMSFSLPLFGHCEAVPLSYTAVAIAFLFYLFTIKKASNCYSALLNEVDDLITLFFISILS